MLKCQRGSALPTLESKTVPGQPDFVAINNYASARAGEIIVNIAEQIKYADLTPEKLAKGIIIVGRGARLSDFNKRLEQLTGLTVRTGTPGNRVRILDGGIQISDSVDVISILNKAAQTGPQQCVTDPTVPKPVAQPVQQPYTQQPYAQQPTNPYGQPAAPAPIQQPAQGFTQPVTPAAAQGQQPVYGQPTNPYAQPAAPVTPEQAPQQTTPVYTQSSAPAAAQSQQPGYTQAPQQPVAPQTPQTGFNQPKQHPYGMPEVQRPVSTGTGAPTPVPPTPPTPEPEKKPKKGGLFGNLYSTMADKIAHLITDTFEEEDDE